MTALLVLKPEFQGTFAAGLARVAGTLVGAAGATLMTVALVPGPVTLIALVLGFVWCGYAFFAHELHGLRLLPDRLRRLPAGARGPARARGSEYRASTPPSVACWRCWSTRPGRPGRERTCAIASPTCSMRIGATWPPSSAALIAGSKPDRARVNGARGAARLARSNAEASVQRMLGEPASRRSIERRVPSSVLATTRRHALAALALQARIEREAQSSPSGARASRETDRRDVSRARPGASNRHAASRICRRSVRRRRQLRTRDQQLDRR